MRARPEAEKVARMKLALIPVALAVVLVAGCGGSSLEQQLVAVAEGLGQQPLLRDHDLVDLGQDGGRVAQERQPLEGRPEEDHQRDQGRHQHVRRRPEGPRQAEHRRRPAGEGRDRPALDRGQRRRRPAAERGQRGSLARATKGAVSRRLEHRHHALDDEHSDRLGRLQAPAGRREGRLEKGFQDAPACKKLSSSAG